jgi:hypothetical protein
MEREMARKPKAEISETPKPEEEVVISVKGFGLDWKCRDFQFEVGKTYEIDGEIKACERGFHAIAGHPLEVFAYYAPATSRYAIVRQSGALSRKADYSKVASAKITIEAELEVPELVKRTWDWVWSRAKLEDGSSATGFRGGASATGLRGGATATGFQGAASATGLRGGAMSSGRDGKAMGADGCAIFLVYRDDDWSIVHAWAGIVGKDGIKPGQFYTLDADGKPVECAA